VATERHQQVSASLTPAELVQLLRRQLRRGLRASRLLDSPELLSFFCPQFTPSVAADGLVTSANMFDQALIAEQRISEAIERIGGQPAQALRILSGLEDGTVGLSLAERRKRAGQVLGTKSRSVSAATFLKHYEPGLVLDLGLEMWRDESSYSDAGQQSNSLRRTGDI